MANDALPRTQIAQAQHSGSLPLIADRRIDALVLLGLIVLVVGLRFPALFRSEINMDDSNFLTMGRELMRGATPYVDFWDHNPLGGAALFGVAGRLFGYSYATLRWMTIAAVIAECFLLYLIGARLARPARIAGIVAAVIYTVYSLNNLGLASDRIFYHAPLAALAIYVAIRQPADARGVPAPLGNWKLLAIGLLVAVSTQLKYLLPVEYAPVAAIVLLDAWGAYRRGEDTRGQVVKHLAVAAVLLAGPTLLLVGINAAYFASRGLLGEWAYANFTANSLYAAATPFTLRQVAHKFLGQVSGNTLAWASLLVALLYGLAYRRWTGQEKRAYFITSVWFFFPLIAVLYARRMDGHHFLGLLPSLSVMSGLVIVSLLRRADAPSAPESGDRRNARAFHSGLLALLILVAALYPQAYPRVVNSLQLVYQRLTGAHAWPHDANVDVASWLNGHVQAQDSLFVVDYNPVIYTMVDRPIPTPFPFPIFLIDGWYEQIIGRSQVGVLDEIMARQPAWIVVQARPNREFTSRVVAESLKNYLDRNYTLVETLQGIETYTESPVGVEIYRINSYGAS